MTRSKRTGKPASTDFQYFPCNTGFREDCFADDPEPRWISTSEAAKRLGLSLRIVYALIDNSLIPAYKFGRVIRFRADDVVAYLETHPRTPDTIEQLFATMPLVELASHEIEGLRRSLAIGNGLPSDQIGRLIETCEAMVSRHKHLEVRDARLRAELNALRPVVAELRQRLTQLTRDLSDH